MTSAHTTEIKEAFEMIDQAVDKIRKVRIERSSSQNQDTLYDLEGLETALVDAIGELNEAYECIEHQ